MLTLTILVFAALTMINVRCGRSLLYPPALFTSVWLVALVVLALSGSTFYPFSDASIVIYIIGGLSFSAGGFVLAVTSAATGHGNRMDRPSDRRCDPALLGCG